MLQNKLHPISVTLAIWLDTFGVLLSCVWTPKIEDAVIKNSAHRENLRRGVSNILFAESALLFLNFSWEIVYFPGWVQRHLAVNGSNSLKSVIFHGKMKNI